MRVDLFGLAFETPEVAFYLWSPWRAAALEHRLFEGISQLPRVVVEKEPDAWRIPVTDPKIWRQAVQVLSRVLKGWQEEAEPGGERRRWRWLLEADTDAHGYDHAGEASSIWAFVRVSLERGGPGEGDRGEDVDLEGFTVRIWGETARGR